MSQTQTLQTELLL